MQIPGYRIESELGRGGMATVFLAVQESLGRRVALKVLAPHLATDPAFTQRFLREGRIAASLRHRNIVAIHDVGVHDGHAYMALEYLPRGSLVVDGPLDPREALRAVREIAAALDVAHRNGVVHRDVKPGNILRNDEGGFVLSDFGIAQLANASQVVTKEGSTVGTPAYMAPEQWKSRDVDGRADLYSLGVVLYQLLTGRVPYSGSDGWAVGMQHMQAPLPALPSALGAVQPVLDRLLAKERDERFENGAAVAAAIEALERSGRLPERAATLADTTPQTGVLARLADRPHAAAALFADEHVAWYRTRTAAALAIGAVVLALVAFAWRGAARSDISALLASSDSLATIAVLPCESYANLAEHRELGDTLAEEVIHRLGRLRALTVVARSSSFPLRDAKLTATELGERLGATHVVSCSVRRTPDGVRVAAELVDANSGNALWMGNFERSSTELLGLVDELAIGISTKLLDQLAGPERALLIRHRTGSIEAVRLVQQGLDAARAYTLQGLVEGRKRIDEAALLDPDYAEVFVARAELAAIEWQLTQRDTSWLREQAGPLVARALELDPDSAQAYVLRSRLRCAEYEWDECRADVEKALRLEPGLAVVQAAGALYYRQLGARARAVEHATRRVQIEPDSPLALDDLAAALIRAGRGDDALEVANRSIERFPGRWTAWRARALALETLGRCGDGIEALERALEYADVDQEVNTAAASLYRCAGRDDRVERLMRELETSRASGDPVNAMAFAVTYIALGRKDDALDTLEAMFAQRDARLVHWITSPLYGIEALGGEPRFKALVARMQLPPDAMSWTP